MVDGLGILLRRIGPSLEDLQDHLKDLFSDLTSGEIPGVRRVAELSFS